MGDGKWIHVTVDQLAMPSPSMCSDIDQTPAELYSRAHFGVDPTFTSSLLSICYNPYFVFFFFLEVLLPFKPYVPLGLLEGDNSQPLKRLGDTKIRIGVHLEESAVIIFCRNYIST